MDLTEIQQIVAPYTISNYTSNREKTAFLFDNNQLSALANVARNHLAEVQHLLNANRLENKDIIIPSTVLWESGKNLRCKTRYLEIYQTIFEELSSRSNVYIVTTEEAFNIFSSSYAKQVDAFNLFKSIAVEMNRAHLGLKDNLQIATTIHEFDTILHAEEEDLGERQAFLIMAALIEEGMGYVEFGSNEHAGVYLKREDYAMQDDLLRLMHIPDAETFMSLFRIKSLNALAGKTILANNEWDTERIETFLKAMRNSRYCTSPVIYRHVTGAASRKFNNEALCQLFQSFPTAEILF